MPADHKKPKTFKCDHPGCSEVFARKHDRKRHKNSHYPYEERPHGCTVEGCTFRANQSGGLKIHIQSKHAKLRVACSECEKTYSDPSALYVHRRKFHGVPQIRTRGNAASGSSSDRRPRPRISRPLQWVNDTQSAPYKRIHNEHQEADANHPDVEQTASGTSPEAAPRPVRPTAGKDLTMARPLERSQESGMIPFVPSTSQPAQPCRCWDCVDRGSLALPPLRGPQWERMEVEREPLPFSYTKTGHVQTSEYHRPNPRMLF